MIESTWGWYIAIIPAVPKIMFVTPRPLGFGENRVRLPLVTMEEGNRQKMLGMMRELGLEVQA